MGRLTVAGRVKWIGIVLLVLLDLLQLHLPHFLIESSAYLGYATYPGLVLLATMLGSVVAVMGIYRSRRWGWLLGVLIASISWVLYLLQEMGGLPGLPEMWWEPTRILSLLLGGLFVILAGSQLGSSGRERAATIRAKSDR